MKANELQPEQVARFVESDDGRAYLAEIDKRWGEVMEPARKCGFILQAAGGVAVLSTYSALLDDESTDHGVDWAVKMLQMSGVEVPIDR